MEETRPEPRNNAATTTPPSQSFKDKDVAEADTMNDVLMELDSPSDAENSDLNRRMDASEARAPMIYALLALIFPPVGWIGFLKYRHAPPDTARALWAFRACAIASALSLLYSFIAASLVGAYAPLSLTSATARGCGFGGKCPLFG